MTRRSALPLSHKPGPLLISSLMASALRLSRRKLSFDKGFPLVSFFREASSSSPPPQPPSSTSSKSQKKSNDRLSAAVDAINERKLPREIRGKLSNVRSETDLVNVVEQRIWHSMEEGHFDNLPGKGKPLNLAVNPHADPAEDNLYRILSKNGCAPEWVELNKEIRSNISVWRLTLKKAWESTRAGDLSKWEESTEALKLQIRDINNKVLRYNLIVPFGRQMFGLNWEKELDRLKDESQ